MNGVICGAKAPLLIDKLIQNFKTFIRLKPVAHKLAGNKRLADCRRNKAISIVECCQKLLK